MTRIGFVGLGSQGAPMARRIVDSGYETTLWARRPESLEPFGDTNAKVANSLLRIQLDGESPDYLLARNRKINAVTLQDVRRVAENVLKPDRLVVTIVGKPKLER